MTLPKKSDSPPEPEETAGGQPVWMVVANTGGMAEASIIAGRLQSLGIPAFIERESLGAVLGLTLGLGQTRVVVPEKYYDAARAVLEPDPNIPWLDDGEEPDDAYDGDEDDSDHDGEDRP